LNRKRDPKLKPSRVNSTQLSAFLLTLSAANIRQSIVRIEPSQLSANLAS